MKHKALHVFLLGMIAIGTTSTNADDVKQWVQDNGQSPKIVGASAGGITAAASLATGTALSALDRSMSRSFEPRADMNNSPAFKRAAERFIWGRDHATHELSSSVDELNQAKLKLASVSKDLGSFSGPAFLLEHKIDKLQSSVNRLQLRISQLQGKIDDVHKYLASGGKALTSLSEEERYHIERYIEPYQRDLKVSALLREAAANSEKSAQKTLMGGVKGMLLGIPVGVGVTLVNEKLRERTIASEKDKVQAEPHSNAVNRSPAVLGSASAEAK